MMRFGQIEQEIRQCEQHLDSTITRNTQAENYIVRYLLVRICAEYEDRIQDIVQRRCTRINDQHLKQFANWAAGMATKRFKIGDLADMLELFGEDYRDAFNTANNDPRAITAWGNIYANRHTVAHGNGAVQMNMSDLKDDYSASRKVIDALVKALMLTDKEIKGLK